MSETCTLGHAIIIILNRSAIIRELRKNSHARNLKPIEREGNGVTILAAAKSWFVALSHIAVATIRKTDETEARNRIKRNWLHPLAIYG